MASHIYLQDHLSRKSVNGNEIKASNVNELSKLALEMQKCEITLSQLWFKSDIDNSDNLRRIGIRLPTHLRTRWVNVAHLFTEYGREPQFSDLTKFVDERARISSSMFGLDLVRENNPRSHTENRIRHAISHESDWNDKGKVTTIITQSKADKSFSERYCRCCSGTCVDLASCGKLKLMSLNDRVLLLRKLKLCYNCLKRNHFSIKCRRQKACSLSGCNVKHQTFLHKWVVSNGSQLSVEQSVVHENQLSVER